MGQKKGLSREKKGEKGEVNFESGNKGGKKKGLQSGILIVVRYPFLPPSPPCRHS